MVDPAEVFFRKCLRTEIWRAVDQRTGKSKRRSTGVSPLRRVMKPRGSGRNDRILDTSCIEAAGTSYLPRYRLYSVSTTPVLRASVSLA